MSANVKGSSKRIQAYNFIEIGGLKMKRQDFNQDWNYHKEGSEKVIPVTLPHDAMIHDMRDPESPVV